MLEFNSNLHKSDSKIIKKNIIEKKIQWDTKKKIVSMKNGHFVE